MEKSAGAVIFHRNKEKGTIEYLLLHYPKLLPKKERAGKKIPGHWDFPKGHVEQGETELEAASRETAEETGITRLSFLPGFQEKIRYIFMKEGKRTQKEVIFFLAEANQLDVALSHEHLGFAWVPFEAALKKITYKNALNILQKAQTFLEQYNQ